MFAKFKVERLSRFRTGPRQVFITQKPFRNLCEVPLTIKTATSDSLETHFLIKLPSVKTYTSFRSNKSFIRSRKKANIWTPFEYFPDLISFCFWNEVNKKSPIKEDTLFIVQEGILQSWKHGRENLFREVAGNRVSALCKKYLFKGLSKFFRKYLQ